MRALLISSVAVVVLAACGGGDDEPAAPTTTAPGAATIAPAAGATTTTTGDPPREETDGPVVSEGPAASDGVLSIDDSGFVLVDDAGERYAIAGAVVTNAGDADATAELSYVLTDGSGAPVAESTGHVLVPAGTSVSASGFFLQELSGLDVAELTVRALATTTGVDRTVAVPVEEVEYLGERGVGYRGVASNPTEEPIGQAVVHCVLLTGGAVVAGTGTVTGPIEPGGSVEWEGFVGAEIDRFVELGVDGVRCSAEAPT